MCTFLGHEYTKWSDIITQTFSEEIKGSFNTYTGQPLYKEIHVRIQRRSCLLCGIIKEREIT